MFTQDQIKKMIYQLIDQRAFSFQSLADQLEIRPSILEKIYREKNYTYHGNVAKLSKRLSYVYCTALAKTK
ncbi:MAG: hypothetical protein A2103_02730 [Gammaproteobacteria bacterium GWF2_41_13]|nr:MAG: hypothetical protein A2103_02730 [Gammaproteobacteria bacterium GWF2_41_13]